MLKLMLITNSTRTAIEAEEAGIDRIFIDLEKNGKLERQGHLDTHIGDHSIEDISIIKNVLRDSELVVRVNPYYKGTQIEVEKCIDRGADIIMLPMFTTKEEVEGFIKYVDGRAKTCLLLETSQAMVRIDDILSLEGIDEIHIGLNDLHICLGLDFMFETLTGGVVDYISAKIKAKGIKLGIGGIAKVGEGDVPSELIIGEHYRLGSEMAILSRTFRNESNNRNKGKEFNLAKEIKKIRDSEFIINSWTESEYMVNRRNVKERVDIVANKIKNNRKKQQ